MIILVLKHDLGFLNYVLLSINKTRFLGGRGDCYLFKEGKHIHPSDGIEAESLLTVTMKEECGEEETMEVKVDPLWIQQSSTRGKLRIFFFWKIWTKVIGIVFLQQLLKIYSIILIIL